jgi:hypothetical protein
MSSETHPPPEHYYYTVSSHAVTSPATPQPYREPSYLHVADSRHALVNLVRTALSPPDVEGHFYQSIRRALKSHDLAGVPILDYVRRNVYWTNFVQRSAKTALAPEYCSYAPAIERSRAASIPDPQRPSGQPYIDKARLEIHRLVRLVGDEVFEDGIENTLSRGIEHLIDEFGNYLIDALSLEHLTKDLPADVISEALLTLGHVDHGATHATRLWFLVFCLRDANPAVRAAASLGLSSLEDPRAAPYLERAADSEQIPLLKATIQKVANELTP